MGYLIDEELKNITKSAPMLIPKGRFKESVTFNSNGYLTIDCSYATAMSYEDHYKVSFGIEDIANRSIKTINGSMYFCITNSADDVLVISADYHYGPVIADKLIESIEEGRYLLDEYDDILFNSIIFINETHNCSFKCLPNVWTNEISVHPVINNILYIP